MPLAFVPFAAFSPGGSAHHSTAGGALARATNVIPLYGGYHPLSGVGKSTGPAAGPVLGGHSHTWPSGVATNAYAGDTQTIFAGTKNALYQVDSPWVNLSRGGGYVAAGEPSGWSFESFGNDIWAANWIDHPQRRTNNAGNFANGIASTFVPIPRFLGKVREFMIAASLNQVGRTVDEFAWSDIDDPTWWDPASSGGRDTSLAGSKTIRSRDGQLMGFVGGEYGVFFKRNSLHSLLYTGDGNDPWRLDEIAHGIGTDYPGSIIPAKDGTYFRGRGCFYRLDGLSRPVRVSPPEIDQVLTDDRYLANQSISGASRLTAWAEDNWVTGAESRECDIKMWTFRNAALPVTDRHRLGVFYSSAMEAWSWMESADLDAVSLLGLPGDPNVDFSGQLAFTPLRDVWAFSWNGTNSFRARFTQPYQAASFRTKRLIFGWTERPTPQGVKIRAVLPYFNFPEDWATASSQRKFVRPDLTISVTRATEPLFSIQTDSTATVVSPETNGPLSFDDIGDDPGDWFHFEEEGYAFRIDIEIPAETNAALTSPTGVQYAGWSHFSGVWVWWEPVGTP